MNLPALQSPPEGDNPQNYAGSLGEKLRLRRKVRKLSLKEVSEKAGVSIGLLSQVERGLTMPSIRSVHSICAALDMPVLWLFEGTEAQEEDESNVVVRSANRRRLQYTNNGIRKEILTPDTTPEIQMLRFTLFPGADSGESYRNDTGGKCGLVLTGTMGLEVDGRHFEIGAGDSFAFSATSWVRFWAIGDNPCEVIWAVSPATV